MYKKITGITLAAMVAVSMSAVAGGNSNNSDTGGNGYGYGGQGGSASAGAVAGAVGVGVGLGGNGGSGGAGGAGGSGGAGGQGGSVVGSGNSSATGGAVVGSGNSTQGQQQGQGQSQVAKGGNANQGQSQSSRNDNKSNASNQNSNANSGNNAQTSVAVTGDSVSYQAARIPVATAYAPNIAPTALCALGVSAGGQGMAFGFSIGGSYIDSNCQQLEQVRTAAAVLGDRETAAEMMCGISDAYREARTRSGKPCGSSVKMGAGVENVQPQQASVKPEEMDPIKRFRLGLPPLMK